MTKLFLILFIIGITVGCSLDRRSEIVINPLPNFNEMWDYTHPDST